MLISTKVRPKRIEHLQGKGIISSEATFSIPLVQTVPISTQQIRLLQTNLFAFGKVEKKSKVLQMHIGNPALQPIYGH